MTISNLDQGVNALQIIAKSIRKSRGSGRKTLTSFLAGLYDGHTYRFNLTELRSLDADLTHACLVVLAVDSSHRHDEIHTWGVFEAAELNRWLKEDGIYVG